MALSKQGVDEAKLTEDVTNMVLTGKDLLKAKRTLKALAQSLPGPGTEETEENLKLVAALGEQVGRVVPSVFQSWQTKIRVAETISKRLWIVKKSDLPELDKDPEVAPFLYDPAQVRGRIDKQMFWFIEMEATILRRLKKRQVEYACAVSLESSSLSSDPQVCLEPASTNEACALQSPSSSSVQETERTAETERKVEEVPEGSRKVLKERISECDMNDETFFQQLLEKCEVCLKEKRSWSEDPKVVTVAHLLEDFVAYVQAKNISHDAQVPEYMKDFPRFVAKQLMMHKSFGVSKHFVPIFNSLEEVQPEHVPGIVKGIHACVAYNVVNNSALDLTCLTPTQKRYFEDSAFYQNFLHDTQRKLIQHVVKMRDVPNSQRLALVERALQGDTTKEENASLLFGKTILSDLPDTVKVKYLLESENMVALLDQWFTDDERTCLKWYGVAIAHLKAKSASVPEVIKGARLLGKCEEGIEKSVYNPVMRGLAKDILGIFNEKCAVNDTKPVAPFVATLVQELIAQKLGCPLPPAKDWQCEFRLHTEYLQKLRKYIDPYVTGKSAQERTLTPALDCFKGLMVSLMGEKNSTGVVKEKAVENKEGGEPAQPPTGMPGSSGAESALTQTQSTEKTESALTQKNLTEKTESALTQTKLTKTTCPADFAVGSILILSAKKAEQKEKYDQKEACIEEVLTNHFKVRMLDGPEKDNVVKYPKLQCSLKQVPAAGQTKRPVEDAGPEQASKKSKAEVVEKAKSEVAEKAKSFFGELSDVI